MRISQAKRYNYKPPPFALIDWNHLLSKDLKVCIPLTEGGGLPRELVTGRTFTGSASQFKWNVTPPYGFGQQCDNVSGRWVNMTSDSRWNFAQIPITLCAFGNMTIAPNSTFQIPFSYGDSGTTGGARWQIKLTNANQWGLTCPSAGATIPSTLVPVQGPYFICVSWDGANVRWLYNGKTETVANANTANGIAGANLFLGSDNNTGSAQTWIGTTQGVMVWSRALGFSEMQSLYSNPWQIFIPPRKVGVSTLVVVSVMPPLLHQHLTQQEPHVLLRY